MTYKQMNAIHKEPIMKSVRTISVALAGTLAFSVAALAQDNGGNRLSGLDTNGDDVLSLEEFLASRIAANVDADEDGSITLEEYTASMQRNIPERTRGDRQRRNGDGQGAGPNSEQMRQRMQERLSERLEGFDADEDGIVTTAEYRIARFNSLDQDGDGLIQNSELTAQRNRGGRGPGRRISGQQN